MRCFKLKSAWEWLLTDKPTTEWLLVLNLVVNQFHYYYYSLPKFTLSHTQVNSVDSDILGTVKPHIQYWKLHILVKTNKTFSNLKSFVIFRLIKSHKSLFCMLILNKKKLWIWILKTESEIQTEKLRCKLRNSNWESEIQTEKGDFLVLSSELWGLKGLNDF